MSVKDQIEQIESDIRSIARSLELEMVDDRDSLEDLQQLFERLGVNCLSVAKDIETYLAEDEHHSG